MESGWIVRYANTNLNTLLGVDPNTDCRGSAFTQISRDQINTADNRIYIISPAPKIPLIVYLTAAAMLVYYCLRVYK